MTIGMKLNSRSPGIITEMPVDVDFDTIDGDTLGSLADLTSPRSRERQVAADKVLTLVKESLSQLSEHNCRRIIEGFNKYTETELKSMRNDNETRVVTVFSNWRTVLTATFDHRPAVFDR